MTAQQTAGTLLIAGSVLFLIGAAIAVPAVFTESDPRARLRLLEEHRCAWLAGQPLYALGPMIAALGVGRLAADAPAGWTRAVLWGAAAALLTGSLAWVWSVSQRASRISEFAFGTLPGWPFTTYVLLTIGGLGLLGSALLASGAQRWLAWLTLGADVLYLAAYLRFGDIPPFVFYLLLALVGVVVLIAPSR